MAIETLRTLGQLKTECEQKGIQVKISGKEKKEDYVKALRSYWLNKYYSGNIPWDLSKMLEIDCPQLCRRYQECKPEIQKKVWLDDNEYVAEEKIDGNRMLIFWDAEKKEFSFYSRNNSVKDFLPVCYKDKILVTGSGFDYPTSFILDSEVISTNPNISTVLGKKGVVCATQLQSTTALLALNSNETLQIQREFPLKFVIFDCLYHGDWQLKLAWRNRRCLVDNLVDCLLKSGFSCKQNPFVRKNKRDFYDQIIARSGEGVVFKNINSPYKASTSRGDWMIKLKRSVKDSLASDIDAFVTGFTDAKEGKGWENLVGGLEFSVKLRKKSGEIVNHVIGCAANIPLDLRKRITILDESGRPVLDPSWYGKVATLSGQNISARAKRLQHCVICAWRPDKSIDGCEILNEEEIDKMIF